FYELAQATVLTTAIAIVARFVWVFPATYLPRWLSAALARRDPAPNWKTPFMLAFTGVRGIVSLAAALAIPFTTVNGQPFPDRDLILFLTFAVILATLVGQGLMLPAVIRALGLAHIGHRERHTDRAEEYQARREAIAAATERLGQLTAERQLSEDVVRPLLAQQRDRLKQFELRTEGPRQLPELHDEIELLLIVAERERINELFRSNK